MKLVQVIGLALIIGLLFTLPQIHSSRIALASDQAKPSGEYQKHVFKVPSGWTVHRGPDGLVVFLPQGWNINPTGKGAFIAYRLGSTDGADALALMQPIESIGGRAAGVVEHLDQMFPAIFPNPSITNLRQVCKKPEVVISDIRYNIGGEAFRGAVLCFKQQQRGVVYVMASTESNWKHDQPVLKEILSSFFYAGKGPVGTKVGPAVNLPEMRTWQDPVENSFTCPVPKGWKVEGGLQRFSAVDARHQVVTTSPDDAIFIRLGDNGIPTMTVNSASMASYGFQEGSWYSPDGLNQWLVMRYIPGSRFLSEFYLPNQFESLTIVGHEDQPQISQTTANYYAQAGIQTRVDSGQLRFEVNEGGRSRKGFGFAQTAFFPMPGMADSGHWSVLRIYGYLANPGQEALAEAVLRRMVNGYRVNPQWQAMQTRTIGKVSKIMSDANEEINNMITQTFANRAASEDRMAAERSRAISDQVLIEDPQSGTRFEVPAGSNYYWRREGTNTFIGTESPDMPNYWLREMTVVD